MGKNLQYIISTEKNILKNIWYEPNLVNLYIYIHQGCQI